MKNQYMPKKNASSMHRSNKAEYDSNNQFVKKVQREQSSMWGRDPKLADKDLRFNESMINTGEQAQRLAKQITPGLDKAFPVK